MFRRLALAALTSLALSPIALLPSPVAAQDAMTPAERSAFGEEVRAYLLENPEVIFEAVAEFERRSAAAQGDMDATLVEINADAIFNDTNSYVGGNPDGDITLVEFSDYRCSFCRRALPEVLRLLEQDGNIRFIIRELPILGPQSELAALFAVSVLQLGGNDVYAEMHDKLMLYDGPITAAVLDALAGELGLDIAEVQARMQTPEVAEIIRDNRALADRLQISGTPTFVMNNELLRGYLTLDAMQAIANGMRG
jgi:protein-disulfide isomerase